MKIRSALRGVSLILAAATVLLWFALGANRGWTKTTVPVPKKDPVTDQEYFEWQKKFVPGVDALGAGLVAAGMLFGLSLLKVRKTKSPVQ